MNILFVADNFYPERNAAASRVYERARIWAREGHRVTVITGAPNFPDGKVFSGYGNRWCFYEQISGIDVIRVWTYVAPNRGVLLRLFDFLSFMVTAFWRILRVPGSFDVVCVTTPQFFAAVGAWAAARIRRIPLVVEVSDLWPASVTAVGAMRDSWAIRMIEKLELAIYGSARRIVVLTNAFKDNLVSRGVRAEKIDVVINGADLDLFCPSGDTAITVAALRDEKVEIVIGYVGTLGMAHDLRNVLFAARELGGPTNERRSKIRFLFIGPGAERAELMNLSKELALESVQFLDPRPRSEMPRVWSTIDIALVHLKDGPVFKTVIPSKIFEAMAMGKAILLVAPEGEATMLIRENDCGWIVPPGDPQALANKVVEIARNPTVIDRLGVNARLASAKYSRDRQAADFMKALSLATSL